MATAAPISLTGGTLSAVLFDMDGTLVDVDSFHYEAYADTLQAMEPGWNGGARITRDFYAARMSGRQNQVLLVRLLYYCSSVGLVAVGVGGGGGVAGGMFG
ncbi:hypothetical protein I4F81_011486 [Pyropia yezoensis]|uniref:Uncharacterized protein n=1 Tax=Pyropia yezoensis TaxID=2788 RepID=A0ACC3CGE8_PYRYE|nr:hypothetical protein I4F81_011486 [Neopyropia yezoensis]